MNELEYLRDKYKNRDIIEITDKTQLKIVDWLSGGVINAGGGQIDLRKVCLKLSENGFIKFLNRGVILVKQSTINRNTSVYPFEFTDYGTAKQTIYISNPLSQEKHTLEILCKIEYGTDTLYNVIDGTFNEKLAQLHIKTELDYEKLEMSHLTSLIKKVNEEQPDLKPASEPWYKSVAEEYFRTIIKTQILSVIGINAYMALMEKDLLVSKIEQKREYKASDGGNNKRRKINPFYRYLVQLPQNYTPRNFDLNYVLSEWQRSGFMTTKWVRPENAEALANRRGGMVTEMVKGKYVAIKIPIAPQLVHRRKKNVSANAGVKTYE